MNLFEAVKEMVPARAAAEHYGIRVSRSGMACCPFHEDKNPSMKVERRYYCFGCGAKGDVIDFVGRLFNLGPKEAAEKLAADFRVRHEGLRTGQRQERSSVLSKLAAAQEYRRTENRYCRVLCTYFQLLRDWKVRYAPQRADEDLHPLFREALGRTDEVEYLLDRLLSGTSEERAAVVRENGKELASLEKRLVAFSCAGKVRETRFSEELVI